MFIKFKNIVKTLHVSNVSTVNVGVHVYRFDGLNVIARLYKEMHILGYILFVSEISLINIY